MELYIYYVFLVRFHLLNAFKIQTFGHHSLFIFLVSILVKLPEIMVGNIPLKRSKIIREYIDDIAQ